MQVDIHEKAPAQVVVELERALDYPGTTWRVPSASTYAHRAVAEGHCDPSTRGA